MFMQVQPFSRLHVCMQKMPYILKLCVMEHLCNTVYDYHPAISHTLNRSGQKVEHFCQSVSTICDIFRGEMNTLYCAEEARLRLLAPATTDAAEVLSGNTRTGILLRILPRMERMAHSYFERCTRAYRGIIVGCMEPLRSIDHTRRLMALLQRGAASGVVEQIMDGAHSVHAPLWLHP